MSNYDLIVVGSGLAGLYAALEAARSGEVLLLTKARLEDCNTAYAQGGIAAALAAGDSPDLHFRDTLVAGDGLCDPVSVRALVDEGPDRVRDLIRLGVPFDRENGAISFTREGAHSAARVLHAGGDATGARIEFTVVQRIRAMSRVTVREDFFVSDLLQEGGRVRGVRGLDTLTGEVVDFRGNGVILATGGAGQLFSNTTNPPVATGDGIALAFRAGAEVADLEFVQFHPTALLLPGAPRFLISEAVRGEGGILRNSTGEPFMPRYDARGDLAPRDVVARAIVFETRKTGDSAAYLDVTHLGGEHMRQRFPTISRVCSEFGLDLGREPIPVAPAAHYLMGGIRTNEWGETSLPGLYACGECACTGLHGANRLASNSLLETLVFSGRAVQRHFSGHDSGVSAFMGTRSAGFPDERSAALPEELLQPRRYQVVSSRASDPTTPPAAAVRAAMWELAGLLRTADGLEHLKARLDGWSVGEQLGATRAELELANLLCLGRLVVTAASLRTESRGAHYRADFPSRDADWRRRTILTNPRPHHVRPAADGDSPATRRALGSRPAVSCAGGHG